MSHIFLFVLLTCFCERLLNYISNMCAMLWGRLSRWTPQESLFWDRLPCQSFLCASVECGSDRGSAGSRCYLSCSCKLALGTWYADNTNGSASTNSCGLCCCGRTSSHRATGAARHVWTRRTESADCYRDTVHVRNRILEETRIQKNEFSNLF